MKALPLWQPWASLVAVGAKRVETRAYPPTRLGLHVGQRIAIHATKAWGSPSDGGLTRAEFELLCASPRFRDALAAGGIDSPAGLPLGAIVATARLARASQITAERAELLEREWPDEFAFGDYTTGRWAWVLSHVCVLAEPLPFRGSQGTFDVPDHLLHLPERARGTAPAQEGLFA